MVNVGKIARVQSGTGFPKKFQNKMGLRYGFYKVGDISRAWNSGSTYLLEPEHTVSDDILKEIKGAVVPKDSVVFAKIGEAVKLNRRAITRDDCLVDNNVFALIPGRGQLLSKFLYYFMRTVDLTDSCRATTVPSLRKSDIEDINLPEFNIDQQEKIVSTLETQFTRLDAAIKSLKAIKSKLEFYRGSILKSIFLEKLERGWEEFTINDLALKIQYGLTSQSSIDYKGPKYLRITDIQNRKVDWGLVPCAKETKRITDYALAEGDLVFARTGATVGKSYLIKECPENAVFASYLIRIVPDLRKIIPELLWYYFQSPMYWLDIKRNQRGIGQPNVNGKILAGLRVNVPTDLSVQRALVDEIESRFSVIDKIKETVTTALLKSERLRKSILKAAFEGKLID